MIGLNSPNLPSDIQRRIGSAGPIGGLMQSVHLPPQQITHVLATRSINEALGITEKHRIPGYVGFVPSMPDQIGARYGEATRECMLAQDQREEKARNTERSVIVGERNLPELPDEPQDITMGSKIPGYQGFVPRMHNHYFASSFGRECAAAQEDFLHSAIRPRAMWGGIYVPDSTSRTFPVDRHKVHPQTTKFT
ncbi:MAG: hypothetical protein EZS28_010898 [Streblomastix strix]|uniref:Ciliary microtubule inner protein 2A-C-like domain-containing protein n=1 Tax=Streblomastix strix TaxID=222440 RepID=A0A5J4WFC0_9EUKA|nr:MAG: hypothetical protein EZS28_010898 [Streblomastix strix]